MALDLLQKYLNWASTSSKYWGDYAVLFVDGQGNYFFMILEAMYFGRPNEEDFNDYDSIENVFGNLYPDELVDDTHQTFNTVWDKAQSQEREIIEPTHPTYFASVFMNETTLQVQKHQCKI